MRSWRIWQGLRWTVLSLLIALSIVGCSNLAALLQWPGKIRDIKQEAIALKNAFPTYPGTVPLPDANTLYSWIAEISTPPHRRPGTPTGHWAEAWVAEQFQQLGLTNITTDNIPITVWTPTLWSLSVAGETIPCYFTVYTGFSGEKGITAPMVYVGEGTERDFKRVGDVSGKIVVADIEFASSSAGGFENLKYFVSDPENDLDAAARRWNIGFSKNFPGDFYGMPLFEDQNVYKRAASGGAAAIALILRDQPSANNSRYAPYDGILKPIPGLWIGKYDGMHLRELAKQGKTGRLLLEGTTEPGYMANVWGVLPGQSDQVILVTTHQDSPHQGAVEDGSGIAQLLGQAWAWSQVPIAERPKTLIFVAAAGHMYGALGGYHFAKDHPDILSRTQTLLTLEHLAAKDVTEGAGGKLVETGKPAPSTLFMSHDARVIAAAWKALEQQPVRATTAFPTFGYFPPTDASGFVFGSTGASLGQSAKLTSGVPFISWISDPYYLLDDDDTLDKIDQNNLVPVAESVTEIVKNLMVLE
jgi:hypothetical protein